MWCARTCYCLCCAHSAWAGRRCTRNAGVWRYIIWRSHRLHAKPVLFGELMCEQSLSFPPFLLLYLTADNWTLLSLNRHSGTASSSRFCCRGGAAFSCPAQSQTHQNIGELRVQPAAAPPSLFEGTVSTDTTATVQLFSDVGTKTGNVGDLSEVYQERKRDNLPGWRERRVRFGRLFSVATRGSETLSWLARQRTWFLHTVWFVCALHPFFVEKHFYLKTSLC